MRLPLALGRKSSAARSPLESVERLLNAYLEVAPDGKEPTPIYGTPGMAIWSAGLSGAIRGSVEMGEVAYWVAGSMFYRVAEDGTEVALGVVPNTDLTPMATDGTNIVLVTEGAIYVWNGTTLGLVTDPDAPLARSVVWIDGYFVFGIVDSQEFAVSALADPTNFDALDFAAAEWKPDQLVTPFLLRRTLYLAGTKTIEAQLNSGGVDFPFTRYQDVLISVGVAGREAITTSNDTAFWLADDLTARRLDGLTATVISPAAIIATIKAWADPSLTVVSAHVWGEHLFVVFRNPDGCVVFDQTTNLWHDRASYNQSTWRARVYLDCYGLKLFGSAVDGTIYKLDDDTYDEGGEILEFEIVTPYAYLQNKRLTVGELEVVAQTGVGGLDSDPKMSCERTKDGEVWSARKYRSLGRAGQRGKRLLFGTQGQGRSMAFKLRITDPVKRAVLGIYAEADAE